MRKILITAFVLMAIASASHAEMEKVAIPCEEKVCFYWWPKLPVVPGWHHDRDYSIRYSFNALTPDGGTFSAAQTVMYAKAPFKPRIPESKTIEMFIENDKKEFIESTPGVSVAETTPLKTADGKILRSFTFFPSSDKGMWERVAYGEEGDFFLTFVISSRTRESYDSTMSKYEEFVSNYKETP